MYTSGPFWGMHLFWWAFWIFTLVSVFGFNVPERVRVNSLDPRSILKRRLAKGDISEDGYKRIMEQLNADKDSVQREVTSQTNHALVTGHPMVDGLSLSVTWVAFYSICSLLYLIAPEVILTATSKLFHGMSFTQMAQTGVSFSFVDFISVLAIGAIYSFVVGAVWSLTHSAFLSQSAERRLTKLEIGRVQKADLRPQTR
jgi:putative membrane protein